MSQALTTGESVAERNKVPDLKELTVRWGAYVLVVVYKCTQV